MTKIITTRKNHRSGGWNRLFETEQGEYVALCEVHSQQRKFPLLGVALSHLPWADWCIECMRPENFDSGE